MKSKENLVFLGMMGSGKSSIGSLVAKKLKLNFVDIDKEIEKNLNITIKKIFEVKGENYFRKIEEQTTLKKLKLTSTVISLGGGAFTNNNIRKEVLKNHLSFQFHFRTQMEHEFLQSCLQKTCITYHLFQVIVQHLVHQELFYCLF